VPLEREARLYQIVLDRCLLSWQVRLQCKPFCSKLVICVGGIASRRQCRIGLDSEAQVEMVVAGIKEPEKGCLTRLLFGLFLGLLRLFASALFLLMCLSWRCIMTNTTQPAKVVAKTVAMKAQKTARTKSSKSIRPSRPGIAPTESTNITPASVASSSSLKVRNYSARLQHTHIILAIRFSTHRRYFGLWQICPPPTISLILINREKL
jgi:hypothetical protein